MPWILVVSKASRELYACEHLHQQSVNYYLPKIVEVVKRGKTNDKQEIARVAPLFPRYIFVHIDSQWRYLLSTFGLIGIVMRGSQPDFVRESIVADLRKREDRDGIIVLPTKQEFKQGQRVKVTGGHMQGQIGIYAGMKAQDRTKVLLDYMGKRTNVLIHESLLQAA